MRDHTLQPCILTTSRIGVFYRRKIIAGKLLNFFSIVVWFCFWKITLWLPHCRTSSSSLLREQYRPNGLSIALSAITVLLLLSKRNVNRFSTTALSLPLLVLCAECYNYNTLILLLLRSSSTFYEHFCRVVKICIQSVRRQVVTKQNLKYRKNNQRENNDNKQVFTAI